VNFLSAQRCWAAFHGWWTRTSPGHRSADLACYERVPAYALLMKQGMERGGKWLASSGLTLAASYLVATAAAGGRHPDWPYFVFGAAAVVGIGGYLIGYGSWTNSTGWRLRDIPWKFRDDDLRGRIIGLPDGGKVKFRQSIGGVVTGLPAGIDLWLLVRPSIEGRFWPQGSLYLDANGRFQAVAYCGRGPTSDVGEGFLLILAAASPRASEEFRRQPQGRGMDKLPDGAVPLDQRRVVRRFG
jgi:hypothetical protein